MESTDSSTGACQNPNLPPGFRFHPTDEELVVHYLKKKAASSPLPVAIIAEVDLYKFDPWELPAKATFGEHEWYFFSPRDRKYPNGARPNRAATSGYWKATGTDKPVLTSGGTQKVGVKKALVFYGGKPPKGIKTNWIMHEYRLADNKSTNKPPSCVLGNKKNSLRLDDWVLCRIYQKNNTNRHAGPESDDAMDDMLAPLLPPIAVANLESNGGFYLEKAAGYGGFIETSQNVFDGGMMSNSISICAPSTSKSDESPLLTAKRTLPPLHWMDELDPNEASPSKRLQLNDGDRNSSITTILSQMPQSQQLVFQPEGILKPSYHLPPFNWFS